VPIVSWRVLLLAALAQFVVPAIVAAAPVEQTTHQPVPIISGTPASLQLPHGLPAFPPPDFACTDFEVRSSMPVALEVTVTSTGLGPATFSMPSVALPCDQAAPGEQAVLQLLSVDQTGQHLRLRIPRTAFSDSVGTVDGRIRVYTPEQAVIDIPLRLENQNTTSWTTFWTILASVSGFALSGVGGALIGLFVWLWQQQRQRENAEQAEFERYVDGDFRQLDFYFKQAFKDTLSTYANDPSELALQIQADMNKKGFLEKIPHRQSQQLRLAFASASLQEYSRVLARIFPAWQGDIKTAALDMPKKQPVGA
jgi:hypothetical protein